ncbi:hypothetical protein IFM89_031057 [Coptis chinensis]|uniref:Glutaredoxin domain-containing protein n=1 Tax=Coptis chinensis TaxID=261450 RepID=A0A835H6I2_9MAGN|nr:hypothetical protein IFM89_031057 [Coptis chinensis]
MGCVSSKCFRKEFDKDLLDYRSHIVSLTSTTYGALNQISAPLPPSPHVVEQVKASPIIKVKKISPPRRNSPKKRIEQPEVINAWELMSDLEDESGISTPLQKQSKGVGEVGSRNSSSRVFNQINSPNKLKKFSGKENIKQRQNGFSVTPSPSPKQVLRAFNSTGNMRKKVAPTLRLPPKSTPFDIKRNSFKVDSSNSKSRRSLSPLFDPELIASLEKELHVEEEQIKKMVSISPKPRNSKAKESEAMLGLFEKKCPSGGECSVIIYTTTLRGIRRTFEDCNNVRSILESQQIQFFERDISMDSGYREELRVVLGKKDIKVPVVFVKGRLIGGVDEMMKMEDEGQLGDFV